MKPYYSIISASIRPDIQENITVALLLVTANGVFFGYSKNKLSVIRSLIDPNLATYLTDTLKQMSVAADTENKDRKGLFGAALNNHAFSLSGLEYSSRYYNNLLHFSKPFEIDFPDETQLFDFLFKKYVDSNGLAVKVKSVKSIDKVKEDFYPVVSSFYNTDKEISPLQIKNLPLPLHVDMIGKNEKPVFAQFIDFDKQLYYIKQDFGTVNTLKELFNNRCHSFIVGCKPDKTENRAGYEAWDNLSKWKGAEFVTIEEIDKIKEYAVKHGVKPLFEK